MKLKKKLEEVTRAENTFVTNRTLLKAVKPLLLELIYEAGGPELTAIDFYDYLERILKK